MKSNLAADTDASSLGFDTVFANPLHVDTPLFLSGVLGRRAPDATHADRDPLGHGDGLAGPLDGEVVFLDHELRIARVAEFGASQRSRSDSWWLSVSAADSVDAFLWNALTKGSLVKVTTDGRGNGQLLAVLTQGEWIRREAASDEGLDDLDLRGATEPIVATAAVDAASSAWVDSWMEGPDFPWDDIDLRGVGYWRVHLKAEPECRNDVAVEWVEADEGVWARSEEEAISLARALTRPVFAAIERSGGDVWMTASEIRDDKARRLIYEEPSERARWEERLMLSSTANR